MVASFRVLLLFVCLVTSFFLFNSIFVEDKMAESTMITHPRELFSVVMGAESSSSLISSFFPNSTILVPMIIIDHDILRTISDNNQLSIGIDRKILIAVDEVHRGKNVSRNDTQFDVIYYSSGLAKNKRDYWIFTMEDGTKRAMLPFPLQSSSLIFIPADIPTFLKDWQSARFIECMGTLKRNETELAKRVIPLSFLSHMAALRDDIKDRGARLMLSGGSLLGWYRECSLIPHTTDIDFFIRAEEYNPEIKTYLDSPNSPYKLFRIYGTPTDSYELSLTIKKVPKVNIDLFFLYTDEKESFVGGLAWYTRQKYKWSYPRITEVCTADLVGRLFYVPCNTKEVLDMEYGQWSQDASSNSFVWYKSHKNVKENGFFSKEEMKGMRAFG